MRRVNFWRLPVLLGAACMALPSLLLFANGLHRGVAGVPIYSDTALHGVQPPAPLPRLTRASVLSVEFMHQYAAYFARHFPLLAASVRIKGQIYWSLLDQSPTWYISLGRHRVLYENAYLDEYCSRDIAAFTPVAERWAGRLKRMQDWYAAHGKIFVYLLTPSKASIEPETMPPARPCRAALAQRAGLHAAYRAILRKAGVDLVDTVESTQQAKAAYPFAPFPEGGTHFNAVATALAVQRLIAAINAAGGWRRLDDFDFTWAMGQPDDVEIDLRTALNVPYAGTPALVPKITVRRPEGKRCEPVVMAQVGGSFTYQIDRALDLSGCPPHTELYEYFRNTMAFYPGDRRFPVDPQRRRWALTDAAQVVVLEENEEVAARSQHGEALYDLVSERMAAEPAR